MSCLAICPKGSVAQKVLKTKSISKNMCFVFPHRRCVSLHACPWDAPEISRGSSVRNVFNVPRSGLDETLSVLKSSTWIGS